MIILIIQLPDNHKVFLNQSDEYENKLRIINQYILVPWNDFLEQNWLLNGAGKRSPSYILDQCAYGLCYGTFKKSGILHYDKVKKQHGNEVPFSSLSKTDKIRLGIEDDADE